jgi:hypothetical protein
MIISGVIDAPCRRAADGAVQAAALVSPYDSAAASRGPVGGRAHAAQDVREMLRL